MKKVLICFIALSFVFLGCEKKETNTRNQSDGKVISKRKLLTEEIDAEAGITITSTFVQDIPAQIETYGFFYEDGILTSIDTVSVNNDEISFSDTLNTYSNYYEPDDEYYPSNYWGSDLLISAIGWTYGNINHQIYMPEEPYLSFNQDCMNISKGEQLTVSWEPDENYNNEVLIGLNYRGPISGGDYTKKTFYELVDDDGSYTVPSSFLNQLPDASKLEIYFGKANQIILDMDSGSDIEFEIITIIYNSFYCEVYN